MVSCFSAIMIIAMNKNGTIATDTESTTDAITDDHESAQDSTGSLGYIFALLAALSFAIMSTLIKKFEHVHWNV